MQIISKHFRPAPFGQSFWFLFSAPAAARQLCVCASVCAGRTMFRIFRPSDLPITRVQAGPHASTPGFASSHHLVRVRARALSVTRTHAICYIILCTIQFAKQFKSQTNAICLKSVSERERSERVCLFGCVYSIVCSNALACARESRATRAPSEYNTKQRTRTTITGACTLQTNTQHKRNAKNNRTHWPRSGAGRARVWFDAVSVCVFVGCCWFGGPEEQRRGEGHRAHTDNRAALHLKLRKSIFMLHTNRTTRACPFTYISVRLTAVSDHGQSTRWAPSRTDYTARSDEEYAI